MEMFALQWMRDLLRDRKHCLGIFGWPFLSGCSPYCSSSRPTGLPVLKLGAKNRKAAEQSPARQVRHYVHRFAPVVARSIALTLLSSAGDLRFHDRQAL